MKLVFIITGMALGGAESMLLKLVSHLPTSTFECRIVSLTKGGDLKTKFLALDPNLLELDFGSPRNVLRDFFRLIYFLRSYKPHAVQTWMYHADLIGGICCKLARVKKVYWSIRNSTLDREFSKLSTRSIAKICALLSRFIPTNIVSCSFVARDVHCSLGYLSNKFRVIPNGFDLNLFTGNRFVESLEDSTFSVPNVDIEFCFIARFDPQKNHLAFLDSFRLLVNEFPGARVALIGSGCDNRNVLLNEKISNLKLEENCLLYGPRTDLPDLLRSFNFLVLPSVYGEAFPNVLGEAMASGLPCIATNVGDSEFIIGDSGFVVAPGDVDAFYVAMSEASKLSAVEYMSLSLKAQQRVTEKFDIDVVARMFIELYLED